jgi:hypothetical protein
MKKLVSVLTALLVLLAAFPLQAGAHKLIASANPLQDRPVQIGENQATVTFGELGYTNVDLVSPYDSTRIMFSIPPNWKLVPGGTVQLVYEITLSGADVNKITDSRNPYGGALTVTFNDVTIGSIPMDQLGTNTVEFQLPAEALVSNRQDGRHQLAILLNAQFSCVYSLHALISIKETSLFNLLFEASSPQLDLSKLPAPFFLRNSLVPDSTLVVVPDQPSEIELQSALNLLAGFGSMISEPYAIDMVTVGQLTDANKADSNLVFVGKPEGLGALSEAKFPLAASAGGFAGMAPDSSTDGILQMALSPWNDNKVILLVSGMDDAAVAKAAQAVSAGNIFVFENPALAYVSSVQPINQAIPVVQDFTLENLGYATQTLNNIGLNTVDYQFNAAKEQVAGSGGYIDLAYYHSGMISYGVSALSVRLNDQIIGSAVFNKESETLTTERMNIPTGVLRYGDNRLSISTSLLADTTCDTSGLSDPWLVISDQTSLHLPAGTPVLPASQKTVDLKFFPGMFMTRSDLGDLTFVLPQGQLASWKVAGQLAYDLGWNANPLISNIRVAYADNVSSDVRSQSSLIVIGKASDLPFLAEFNDQLPAPFDLTTNSASERNMQIVYRIPSGVSVGYLELLTSPYNLEKLILVASANDDNGLAMAGNTLTQGPLQARLAGHFAVTNGVQVATGSVGSGQFSVVGTVVPGAEQIVATPISNFNPNQGGNFQRPGWLTILPTASGIIIVLVLLYVIFVAIMRRREPASVRDGEKNNRPHDGEEK